VTIGRKPGIRTPPTLVQPGRTLHTVIPTGAIS
jgi:hypothetical protein